MAGMFYEIEAELMLIVENDLREIDIGFGNWKALDEHQLASLGHFWLPIGF
jgi:hypothetical protein